MSENRQIARAAGLVSALTMLSRIGGLIRDAVIGYVFGTGNAADAFFVAFRLPNLMRRLVAEGAANVAFIPVFSDYLANRGTAETARAARAVGTMLVLVLLLLAVSGMVVAPMLTAVFAPGFAADPAKFALTVALSRLVFPYLVLVGIAALLGALLNTYRHFAAPAAASIFLNLAIIGAALVLGPHLHIPVYSLACGVLLGGVLQVLAHVVPLRRRGVNVWPRWDPAHPAVRRVLRLMTPSLFGTAVLQINLVVNTIMASVLPSGSVSYLWYASRVFEFPLGLFSVALGTAALPSFATQAARGAYGELRDSLSFAIRLSTLIAVPATAGLLCLATPITAVLFERGAFGPREVTLTAQALCALTVGLWSASVVRLLTPAFYALHDSRTPVLIGALVFFVNLLVSLMLMGPVAARGDSAIADLFARLSGTLNLADLRHAGLALGTSIAATVNVVLLVTVMRRRIEGLRLAPLLTTLGRSSLAAVVMTVPVRWLAARVDWLTPGQLLYKCAALAAAMALGIGVYAVAMLLVGGEDRRRVLSWLRERLGRS
ncbi:MAG: murein biosynthesis integral membrane protein MurJ [Deltaproteobacteria bacterium]|nr:murein biosynthesis integral membrane protein MurJ [Deltaproteobacteria bacterium]MBI3389159.1 murein biosynthesis integral membrane protein MurJ [Deltaproteobacteria bacterium]